MRFIAIIVVVAIIAVAVILGLLIQRLKSRQSEELEFQRGRLRLAHMQLDAGRDALKTIRDLQGDSSFDAQMALDKMEKIRDEYYNNQEGITQS